MNIAFTKAYVVDGDVYSSLMEAQVAGLAKLLPDKTAYSREECAEILVEQKDAVIDILTTTEKSRPRARRINGGRKTRKPKDQPQTAELPSLSGAS